MKLARITFARNLFFFHNREKWPAAISSAIEEGCSVWPNFVTADEEAELMKEVEPKLKRLKYETSHWDDAIQLFRERRQSVWSQANKQVIERILETFPSGLIRSSHVHILDLHKDGFIRPHIDSVKYCGDIVTGVSLLSDCIMRLRHQEMKDELIVDLHLPRLSLYKLSGPGRYEFTHEILPDEISYFADIKTKVKRDRRISVICRDEPKEVEQVKVEFKPIPVQE